MYLAETRLSPEQALEQTEGYTILGQRVLILSEEPNNKPVLTTGFIIGTELDKSGSELNLSEQQIRELLCLIMKKSANKLKKMFNG